MEFSRSLIAPALGLALLFLQGCTSWQVNQIAGQLPALGAEQALQKLDEVDAPARDRAQYLLNRGMLNFYVGDLAASRTDLAEAQRIMASLQATSVVENLASVSTNETLRSYTGTPTDQVLVHAMLALTYLCEGNLDGARVEILQSQVEMQRLAKQDSSSGQLSGVRFLAGIVYELQREWDDALISYRQAYQILQQRGQPVPMALQDSLLMLTRRMGLDEEHDKLSKTFARTYAPVAAGEGELFVLFFDGVVSSKHDARISVVAGDSPQMVTVVVPTYHPSHYMPRPITLQVNGERVSTQVIEDLEARARDDLSDEMTRIMATTTTRAVAKYNLVNNAQNKSDMAGLLANLATVVTEQADVRSWNMLPASIQVARVRVPAGAQVSAAPWVNETADPLLAAAKGLRAVLVLGELIKSPLGYPPVQAAGESSSSLSAQSESLQSSSSQSPLSQSPSSPPSSDAGASP